MSEKPSYEALEKQIHDLKEELAFYRKSRAEAQEFNNSASLIQILNSMEVGLILHNPDQTVAWVNQSIRRSFPEKNPVGHLCYKFFQGKDDPCDPCAVRDCFRSGQTCTVQRYSHANGRWYYRIAQPLFDEAGNVKQALESVLDITDQVQIERSLNEKEEKYRFIVDNVSDVIITCDADGNYTYLSPSHQALLGRGEELIGRSVFEHMHPDDVDQAIEIFTAAMDSGRMAKGEYRYWHPERGYIWIESSGQPYVDEINRLNAIITSREITERKRVEESLRDSEKRLSSIIEFFPDAVLAVDKEKRVTIWNKAVEEMTGIPASEMIGKGDHAYTIPFYGEARPQLMDMVFGESDEIAGNYTDIVAHGDTLLAETYCNALYNKKGAWVFAKAAPLYDASGNFIGAIESIRDITSQKQAEEALKTALSQQTAILESSMVGIMLLHNRIITKVNPRMAEMLGYTPEEMEGKGPEQLHLSYDHFVEFGEKYYWRLAEKTIVQMEYPLRHKNGEIVWCLFSGRAIEPPDLAKGAVWTIDDITERKRLEEELRQSEEKYRNIFLNLPLGIFRSTLEGQFLEVNPALAEMLGYDSPESVIKNIYSISEQIYLRPDKRCQIVSEQMQSKEFRHYINHYKRRDGSEFIANLYLKTLYEQGKPACLEGMVEDITDRRQAEEALRESEEKYRNLFENAHDAIYVAQDEKIKYLNPRVEEVTGYSRDELMQMDFGGLIHPEDREVVMSSYKRRLAGETPPPVNYAFRIIKKTGEEACIQLNAVLIKWDGRAATLNFGRDITDQKKLEAQLQQSQKMEALGTLAGGIAHDFNNILSSVIGFTELSLDQLECGTPLHSNLSEVMNAGIRAKDLVKQILTLSRQEKREKKPINLVPLLKETLKLLRSTVPTSIEIKQKISNQNLIVYADPTQMHQVIMNLATNAVHAMEDMEGILELRAQPISFDQEYMDMAAGDYVNITVSDTGAGIPDTFKDKIFEPYYTTKDKGQGTGLGLSVVHGIITSHNGKIIVYSEPSVGTTFHVYLPRADRHSVALTKQPSVQLPSGNESILIVDDELPIVKMHQQSLERIGYKTTARSSSVEALEAFKASADKYDLIITDMTMPQMTGEKLAKAIKEIRPDIPVVLCTGFSERVEERGKELAIDGILMKPIDKKEMAETVRKLLDKAKGLT